MTARESALQYQIDQLRKGITDVKQQTRNLQDALLKIPSNHRGKFGQEYKALATSTNDLVAFVRACPEAAVPTYEDIDPGDESILGPGDDEFVIYF